MKAFRFCRLILREFKLQNLLLLFLNIFFFLILTILTKLFIRPSEKEINVNNMIDSTERDTNTFTLDNEKRGSEKDRQESNHEEDEYYQPVRELQFSGAEEDEENLSEQSFHNLQYIQLMEQMEQQNYQQEFDLQVVGELTTELTTLILNICADQALVVANN